MSAKQLAERVLRGLPDDATVEDVHYSLYVAELLERRSESLNGALSIGVDEAIRQGKLVPHEDVVKRMGRWLRK
jgi:hypothetical protein